MFSVYQNPNSQLKEGNGYEAWPNSKVPKELPRFILNVRRLHSLLFSLYIHGMKYIFNRFGSLCYSCTPLRLLRKSNLEEIECVVLVPCFCLFVCFLFFLFNFSFYFLGGKLYHRLAFCVLSKPKNVFLFGLHILHYPLLALLN